MVFRPHKVLHPPIVSHLIIIFISAKLSCFSVKPPPATLKLLAAKSQKHKHELIEK